MKPGERNVPSATVAGTDWRFTADNEGSMGNGQIVAACAVELVRLVKQHTQTLEELLVAVKALDVTSLEETREAVRELLRAEFGLERK